MAARSRLPGHWADPASPSMPSLGPPPPPAHSLLVCGRSESDQSLPWECPWPPPGCLLCSLPAETNQCGNPGGRALGVSNSQIPGRAEWQAASGPPAGAARRPMCEYPSRTWALYYRAGGWKGAGGAGGRRCMLPRQHDGIELHYCSTADWRAGGIRTNSWELAA
jgi:hypothetical protein